MIKIGFDLDNVIVPLYDFMLKIANFRYKTNLKLEDWKEYRMTKAFPSIITEERLEDIYREIYSTMIILKMPAYEGAIETINKFSHLFDDYFITARYGPAQPQTWEWFQISGLDYNPEKVYFDSEKSELAKSLDINVFIEDSAANAIALAKKGIDVILFDQPWNRELKESPLINRIKNWKDIEAIFNSLTLFDAQPLLQM